MVPPDSVRAATVSLVQCKRYSAVDRHQAAADDGVLNRGRSAHRHRRGIDDGAARQCQPPQRVAGERQCLAAVDLHQPPLTMASSIVVAPLTVTVEASTMVPPDSVRAATVSLSSVSVTPLSIATNPPLTMASSIVVAPLTVTVEASTMVPPDSVRAATVSPSSVSVCSASIRHEAAGHHGVLDRGRPAHRHRGAIDDGVARQRQGRKRVAVERQRLSCRSPPTRR